VLPSRSSWRASYLPAPGPRTPPSAQALTEALIAFESRRARSNDPSETGKAFAERLRDAQRIDKRITIRLGGEDAAAMCYRKAVTDIDEMSKFIYEAHGESLETQPAEELMAALTEAEDDFLQSAHAYRMK
jgi:hypothetical protein